MNFSSFFLSFLNLSNSFLSFLNLSSFFVSYMNLSSSFLSFLNLSRSFLSFMILSSFCISPDYLITRCQYEIFQDFSTQTVYSDPGQPSWLFDQIYPIFSIHHNLYNILILPHPPHSCAHEFSLNLIWTSRMKIPYLLITLKAGRANQIIIGFKPVQFMFFLCQLKVCQPTPFVCVTVTLGKT